MMTGVRVRSVVAIVLLGSALIGCSESREVSSRPQHLDLAIDSPKRSSVPVAASYGPLVPDGRYYTSLLRPAVRFSGVQGWEHQGENSEELYLGRRSGAWADLYVVAPHGSPLAVYDPPVTREQDPVFDRAKMRPFPKDYLSYLASSPVLRSESIVSTTLMGLDASLLKATVSLPRDEGGLLFVLFSRGISETEPDGSALWAWSVTTPQGTLYVLLVAADATVLATDPGVAQMLQSLKVL
jgi:hypothetical protein